MRIEPSVCPHCCANIAGTADIVPALAYVNRSEDGTYEWAGESKVFWDGQESVMDSEGLTLVQCDEGHEFEARVEEG